jgi:hypothetical protein
LLVPFAFLLLFALFPSTRGWLGLLFVAAMVAISIRLRLYYATACLLTYALSLLFLSLLGLAALPRLALGTWFCLPLGICFFLLQNPAAFAAAAPSRALFRGSIAIIVIVFWLYAANFVVTTPAKSRFWDEVEGQRAAIKVSDEPLFAVSLFYTGDQQLLYTLTDATPIGGLREYRSIELPTGGAPKRGPAGSVQSREWPVIFR